jgi:PiT family inorganic phosphate transporter
MVSVFWIFRRDADARRQLVPPRTVVFGALARPRRRGDAQKTMGIIAVLLYANGVLGDQFYVPLWVISPVIARASAR